MKTHKKRVNHRTRKIQRGRGLFGGPPKLTRHGTQEQIEKIISGNGKKVNSGGLGQKK
jgi:hypothetical protein